MVALKAYLLLVKVLFYVLFWNLFEWVKIIWRVFNKTIEINPKHARLQKIIFSYHRMDIARRQDFFTVDDGFISFETLKFPEWTIYSFDKNGAIMVELQKPLFRYTIDKYPFVHLPIFSETLRVAQMDLNGYISLCEELEIDYKPPKTLFFSNTARCGSTLFGAMLQHDGYSTVIAEHHCLSILAVGLKNNYWNEKEISRLLPATIKYLRKGLPSSHLFIYKASSTEIYLVPHLTQHFPEMKHIFMFRRKGLNSVEKMIVPFLDNVLLAMNLYKLFFLFGGMMFFYRAAIEWSLIRELKPKTNKEIAMIIYGTPYLIYKQNQELFDFPIVWYDELLDSPETILSPIFEKLGIPQSCIANAVAQTQNDSQANTPMSQESYKNVGITQMTSEVKKTLQHYAEKFQMEPDVSGLND